MEIIQNCTNQHDTVIVHILYRTSYA